MVNSKGILWTDKNDKKSQEGWTVPQAKLKTHASSTQIHSITAAPTSSLSMYMYEYNQ